MRLVGLAGGMEWTSSLGLWAAWSSLSRLERSLDKERCQKLLLRARTILDLMVTFLSRNPQQRQRLPKRGRVVGWTKSEKVQVLSGKNIEGKKAR